MMKLGAMVTLIGILLTGTVLAKDLNHRGFANDTLMNLGFQVNSLARYTNDETKELAPAQQREVCFAIGAASGLLKSFNLVLQGRRAQLLPDESAAQDLNGHVRNIELSIRLLAYRCASDAPDAEQRSLLPGIKFYYPVLTEEIRQATALSYYK